MKNRDRREREREEDRDRPTNRPRPTDQPTDQPTDLSTQIGVCRVALHLFVYVMRIMTDLDQRRPGRRPQALELWDPGLDRGGVRFAVLGEEARVKRLGRVKGGLKVSGRSLGDRV